MAICRSNTFPFYFSWDMDLIVIQDLLLMQNNQLPTHLNHPGLGMYWLLFWMQDIAQMTGLITEVSIANLGNSLEPLLIVAEQMEFIRVVNALYCILLSLISWKVVTSVAPLNKWQSTLSLVVFLIIPGIWRYDIPLVRTETYSLIFWALALLFTIKAARENIKFNIYTIAAGFFAALSFFTKIQSFFLVGLLPIIFLIILGDKKVSNTVLTKPFRFWLYLLVFLALCGLSILYWGPRHIVTFASAYWPNKFFAFFIGLLIFVKFYTSGKHNSLLKIDFPHNHFSSYLVRFLQGAALILIFPLLMPMDPLKSMAYSLLSFKMVFVRWIEAAAFGQHGTFFSRITITLQNNWSYLALLFISVTIILIFHRHIKDRYRFYAALAITLILGTHILLAVRPSVQDSIWVEVPIIPILLILCLSFEKMKMLVTPILILLGVINIYIITGFKTVSITKGIAYYDSHMFFEEVYRFDSYNEAINRVYKNKEQKDRAVVFASRWKEWQNILRNNFSESNLTLREISELNGNLIIHLNKIESKDLNIHYRPDMVQTIYLPESEISSLSAKDCELVNKSELSHEGKSYMGYAVKAFANKGRYPLLCSVHSDFLDKGFVVVNMAAMATFRMRFNE